MPAPYDFLLLDARLATMRGESGYGLIDAGAIGVVGGRLAFVGAMADLPEAARHTARSVRTAHGALVTPGLIDCHTHLVFAGDRADEFEMRLQGKTYAEIAAAGGGIRATVRKTRAAAEDELFASAVARMARCVGDGTTAIEIKSGYGLTLQAERTMLLTARRLAAHFGVFVQKTFLGLHALPEEYADRRAAYVAEVRDRWLPALVDEGLVDAVDAFCEGIAFTVEECEGFLLAAEKFGLSTKLHADQLSDMRAAALAAKCGAASADHLEFTDEDAVAEMAKRGTVAVLLPGAFYCLREKRMPPVDAFRRHGVAMAVASDLNPGTSPLLSLRHAMNQACVLFGLQVEEVLRAVTCHAARAIGQQGRKGRLETGFDADFVIWDADRPAALAYWIGARLAQAVYVGGREWQPGGPSADIPSV